MLKRNVMIRRLKQDVSLQTFLYKMSFFRYTGELFYTTAKYTFSNILLFSMPLYMRGQYMQIAFMRQMWK